jgi:hypothetical protein
MAEDVRKFKFISPGVFVNEIDQSQLPETPGAVGPLLIGSAQSGPMLKPVQVNSYGDFVASFGEPLPGGIGGDPWRNGNKTAPTYAPYAAKAYMANNAPLTYVRVGGLQAADASEAGYAGWEGGDITATPSAGGAFGIFVFPSSSVYVPAAVGLGLTPVTGALAAVLYMKSGRAILSGVLASSPGTDVATGSACEMFESDANGNLKLIISEDGTDASNKLHTVSFNFDQGSKQFIRKVLNTNPTITNSTITTAQTRAANQGGNYWLGETYETVLSQRGASGLGGLDKTAAAGMGVLGRFDDDAKVLNTKFHAAILPLQNALTVAEEASDRRYAATRATTGWFIAQDNSADFAEYMPQQMRKLFRLEATAPGSWAQREVKISISNLSYAQGDFQSYGTFSVLVRGLTDTDKRMNILERFDNLNLNPASANYIGKVIGDKFQEYNATDKGMREYGTYDNNSDYIRVVVSDEVEAGSINPDLLPFGVFGPTVYRSVSLISGSGNPTILSNFASGSIGVKTNSEAATVITGGKMATFGTLGGSSLNKTNQDSAGVLNFSGDKDASDAGTIQFSGSIIIPSVPLRGNSTWAAPRSLKSCFWGAWTGKTAANDVFSPTVIDMIRPPCRGQQSNITATTLDVASPISGGAQLGSFQSSPLNSAWVFSLDDVSGSADGQRYYYVSGSRQAGLSLSAKSGSYTSSIDAGLDRFTTVMFGGADGLDITEKNPLRNALMDDKTIQDSSVLYSLRAAVNMASDPERLQYNMVAMPGVTQPLVTDYLLEAVEDRADALAIIDLPLIYLPESDSNASAETRRNYTVKQAVDNLKSRSINNSYGATYSPWVMIRDTNTNRTLWVPPSVPALGALSTTDRTAAPWFAPAGFTRGGLSEGAGGLPVLDVTRRLTSDDRDDLYETNINPIAKFPAEGIVIFGQKTLQQTASALDRINVRRLLIFLKREISFIASRLLFGPNVPATWANFTSQAGPLLSNVKAQFGIDDFKLILDESTTTPDLIDRNIIYAKLFIKPTRAAEYFAIDFIVSRSGASFED